MQSDTGSMQSVLVELQHVLLTRRPRSPGTSVPGELARMVGYSVVTGWYDLLTGLPSQDERREQKLEQIKRDISFC